MVRDGISDMKRILLMLTFCFAIECLSTEQSLAQQIPPTARTIEAFRRIEPQMSMKQVIDICGVPDEDTGSGIHIYVYKLSDRSLVRIGTPDKKRLIYIVHVLPNGEARSIIKIPERKDKRKRRAPSRHRPTTTQLRATSQEKTSSNAKLVSREWSLAADGSRTGLAGHA